MMNTLSLWSGSALLAISTVAMAQDAVPPSSPSPESETAPTQPQAATSTAETAQVNDVNDDDGLAEVVVTAQRREERLKDVPLTVSAMSSEQLTEAGEIGRAHV